MKLNLPSLAFFSEEHLARRMTNMGIVLGLSLIIIALSVELVFRDLTLTWPIIGNLYTENPIHWIILTSPFFLGTIFHFLGSIIAARQQSLTRRADFEKKQFSLLEDFITKLEAGEFQTKMSDDFENSSVAGKLLEFRDKLSRDKREEEQRIWESEGLAKFSEVLRSSKDVNSLANDVVRFLVKYLKANQGSLFLLNQHYSEEQMLDLAACYAYDRKKFVSNSIAVGNGLVGQCFLERETIILHEVPKDYIKITSGLGMATPGFVAIIPMKAEDEVTGVLEVASFQKMPPYQINFLEKACQAFASVVKSVMTSENVQRLLAESQQQTEELRTQEEEMRQNMEELQAIQDQLTRQLHENSVVKNDLEAREYVLSKTTILSESDLHGTIIYVNSKFCEVSQYRKEELLGKGHNIVRHPDMPSAIFKLMWATIKKGETFRGIVKNRKKDGTPYWVDATIVPIVENGRIVKYIGARYHIEDETIAQRLFDQQLFKLGLTAEPVLYE